MSSCFIFLARSTVFHFSAWAIQGAGNTSMLVAIVPEWPTEIFGGMANDDQIRL